MSLTSGKESKVNNARQTHKAGAMSGAARSTAQATSAIIGLVLIAVGILGFFYGDASFTVGEDLERGQFLGFAVNGWHNVVHIATGAFLLLMLPTLTSAVTGLLVFGVVYAVVTVWGFIDQTDVAEVIPVDTADNVLHAVLAGIALIVAVAAGGLKLGAKRKEPS